MTRPLRQPVHRGSVEAVGLFLSAAAGEASMRERALSLWEPGAEVHRMGGGLVVLFPSPRRVLTRASPGAPLVRQGGLLCAAPLAADELEALAAPSGSVVLVSGGRAQAHARSAATLEDPARWLELAAFEGAQAQGLGLPPEPVKEVLVPVKLALRERLRGKVPSAAAEMVAAAAALREALEGGGLPAPAARGFRAVAGRALRAVARWLSPSSSGQPGSEAAAAPREGGEARSLVAGALRALARWFSGSGGVAEAGRVARRAGAVVQPGAWRPTWRSRLAEWLNRAAAKAAVATGLARILGARQAEYFSRMMQYFEDGDLEQALRHAIPLGGPGDPAAGPALGVPKPRDDLSIPLGPRAPGSAIGATGDLMGELRALYRRTFQRLQREGQIERAAFVLAELLGATEEAVAFLEKHGQARLAAELAESRGLASGLVVRQWFVAGDVARAVAVARRTGAFADALVRLKQTYPDLARSFALIWADTLADAGNYWGAADVVWGVPGTMSLAAGWLDRAIDVGGPVGARALVRRLSIDADRFQDLRPRALAVLNAPAEDDGGARRAFVDELTGIHRRTGLRTLSPPLAVLARGAVRALARDAGEGAGWVARKELEALARLAGEPAVEADLPPLPPERPRRGTTFTHRAGVPGQRRVHDVALLPNGRLLVAHGESGAELVTRDGRRVYAFDVPAHSVVVSDHGDRAIAVAPRGEQKLLSRLDLRTGEAKRWCEAPVRAFAKDYDGDVWFTSEQGALLAVDARAGDLRALWRLPGLPGGVLGIARRKDACHFLVQPDFELSERWSLELPSYTLRSRTPVEALDKAVSLFGVGPDGAVICADYPGMMAVALGWPAEGVQRLRVFRKPDDAPWMEIGRFHSTWPPSAGEGFAAAFSPSGAGVLVSVVDTNEMSVAARVELPDARLACVRFSGMRVAVGDDLGRVVALDLERGCVTGEIRR